MEHKTAIIIGGGPAGLTAAYELLHRTDIKPIVYEMSNDVGGISKTINYEGNRIDIGGHRFFSKSDRVMDWWLKILPVQGKPSEDDIILESAGTASKALNPEQVDKVMLIRNRLSRIFFIRKFFDYPISLNSNTLLNLGVARVMKIGLSYLKAEVSPIQSEASLEDFFINRFGTELYLTFFKDYTEKVWGIPCNQISAEWGAQRVKGLSVTKAIMHALKSMLSKEDSIAQKNTETSLIEQFLYPKFGPGQMWEEVARIIVERGGKIQKLHQVVGLSHQNGHITEATIKNEQTGDTYTQKADYFFSTMPVKELIASLGEPVPAEVKKVAQGLLYRDFITVGLLLNKLRIKNQTHRKTNGDLIPDNWIYIQEKDVMVGRLQIFNNWSPYMVKDKNKVWIGLEYFCNEGDELWNKADAELSRFAIEELAKIQIIDKEDVIDSIVIRIPKTYPAYFGSYNQFHVIRNFTDSLANLFLIGRNGMHRYNNQDHSMLTAMKAVDNILNHEMSKQNIWDVNTEDEYHESK